MSQTLVLGLCANYDWAGLQPFVGTLRRVSPETHVCFYVHNLLPETIDTLRWRDVEMRDAAQFLSPRYHGQSARYFMYRDYLAAEGAHFTHAMLADVRDVIFQSSPFAAPWLNQVEVATESKTIAEERWNTQWIRDFYGEAMLAEIGGRTISCSGTTIGTSDGIRRYVDLMCHEIETLTNGRWTPHDQGFHNYILHKLAPPFISADTSWRRMATVGTLPKDGSRVTVRDGRICVDGAVPPVVHQYDRHKNANEFVKAAMAG